MDTKTFVLGIDGVPHSFLNKYFEDGKMPFLAEFSKKNQAKKMNSVYPTISSVAWTSYMTGTNPAGHNIFGFIDRIPNPLQMTINTGADRKAKTFFENLSEQGKKIISINVPMTYPPFKVNGILVSGFLCPDIEKVSYPKDFCEYLKNKNYCIDVDAFIARESKQVFIRKILDTLDKRFEIAFDLMDKEKWDFFQLHIMETDRLFHFFWDSIENRTEFSSDVKIFFKNLDNHIKNLYNKLPNGSRLLILSDHGFCGVKYEVQVNAWLEKQGLLKFTSNTEKSLNSIHPDTICYSLLPGRIFINLKGREQSGQVKNNDYDTIRNNIKEQLKTLTDPQTNEPVLDKIFLREDIYDGRFIDNSADIIVHPKNGYDLKSKLDSPQIFTSSIINGMHTYDDAFICGFNIDTSNVESIEHVKQALGY